MGMMVLLPTKGSIVAKVVEDAGTLNKTAVRMLSPLSGCYRWLRTCRTRRSYFSPDCRESKFEPRWSKLFTGMRVQKRRNRKIVWPEGLKETSFVLPEWYNWPDQTSLFLEHLRQGRIYGGKQRFDHPGFIQIIYAGAFTFSWPPG